MPRVKLINMRRFLFLALALSLALPAFAADSIPLAEYRARRAALQKTLDGTLVLFGRTEGQDEVYGFTQEPNFQYLTGWPEPGAILLLTAARETLFLPHHREPVERFAGKRASAEDRNIAALAGFSEVLPIEKFESTFDKALDSEEKAYSLPAQPALEKLKGRYPLRTFSDAKPMLGKLRIKKSPAEIAAIQHTTDVTVEGHRAAWKRMAAGLYEYQLAATVTNVYMENGCERHAYAPIVGSGFNGTVLHYSANKRRMDQGEVVVMDTAAECSGYASDVTRTIPVAGKFTPRQRELYEVVLGAQKAAIDAIKPGVAMAELTKLARDYMKTHGKDLRGQPLDKYFVHGLGHPVGLEVHDAGGSPATPLEAGSVITIEPGLYIPEESIGIRIEDVVLVTESGSRVLSAALPREPGEIEKALAK